jgi:hypothetical protein
VASGTRTGHRRAGVSPRGGGVRGRIRLFLGLKLWKRRVAAWFPLGPGEPFIPWYDYSPGYLRQVNVTNVRNVTGSPTGHRASPRRL